MLDVDREEITGGSIPRVLVILAVPLLVQNLVQVLQQIVDTLWLGRHSLEAVAAVGLTFPLVGLLSAIAIGAATGTQVLVAQRTGAEDLDGGRRIAFNGTVLGFVVGAVVGVAVFVLAREIVAPFGASGTVTEFAARYLAVYALVFPVLSASDALEAGFVGWGDTRAALYVNALAVGVNVLLDPVLIFGWWYAPELGVAGAALATGIGYGCGFALGIGMALRGRDGFVLNRANCRLDRADWRGIVDVGWPTAGQYAASQTARVGMIGLVALVGGTAGLAAYTIGARVATVAFVPAIGLQQAAQSVVGQNLGAKLPERARRTTWVGVAIASLGLAVVGVVQLAIPQTLSVAFVPDASSSEIDLAATYLRILAIGYPAIGATYLLQAGFNGASRTRTSLVATLLQYWIVRLPLAALIAVPLGMGVVGVFWAVTASNVAVAIGLAWYYRAETGDGMNDGAVTVAATD